MHASTTRRVRRLVMIPVIGLAVAACGGNSPSTSMPSTGPSAPPASAAEPAPTEAAGSEAPGGSTSGDVPDNAVFLTYKGMDPGFSIQYVEGWQVTPQGSGGVVIEDKDSSETVSIVASTPDVAAYVASTDLPALQAQPGFKLITQDAVRAGSSSYVHLAFRQVSPPDSVTGKQVPQVVDRYYVPGPNGLAVVSLATPDGVDNVDAFRQMIESFTWS